MTTITQVCKPIPEERRAGYARLIFGNAFPSVVEPTVYHFASMLSPDCKAGMWLFNGLCPSGFFMQPDSDSQFRVVSPNGFDGLMSSEALGLVASMFTFSHLAFGRGRLAEVCGDQFHQVRNFALNHPEVDLILAACD